MNADVVFYTPDNQKFSALKANYFQRNDIVDCSFYWKPSLNFLGCPAENNNFSLEQFSRSIGLWEKTCFELFIKNLHGEDYYELNFSADKPEWNAFYFKKYRSPLEETTKVQLVNVHQNEVSFTVTLKLPAGKYSFHPKAILFQEFNTPPLFLSDVKHPKTGPDFHIFSVTY